MTLTVCLAVAAVLTSSDKPKLMVLELAPTADVEASLASGLTDAVSAEVAQRGFFDVLSAKDVQTMLGAERQRQLLGCSDEGTCLTELAGAAGARFIVSGQLAKLGSAYQLSLEGLDTKKARPLGRSTRLATSVEALRAQIPYAVAEATGAPLPAPPSNVLSYSLLGLGAAGLLAGAYFGIDGLSRESQLNQTIQQGQLGNAPLANVAYYQQLSRDAAHERTAALVSLGAGVGAATLGVLFFHRDPSTRGGVAVLPMPNGVAFAGVFP